MNQNRNNRLSNNLHITTIYLLTIMTIFVSSCNIDPNKQVDEGKVINEYYSSDEIGWTIKIPNDWNIMTKNKLDKNQDKGMEYIEETIDTVVDYSGLKHLISFQKDKGNVFQSTSEPFELEYAGEWEESNRYLYQVIYETYQNQGIRVDTSSTIASIDGLKFDLFKIKMYNPQGKLILNQDMYSRLINGYGFSVILSYNNRKDKQEMMDVWTNSKFKK